MNAVGPAYQHWTGQSTTLWQRRAAITTYGLRLCWRSRLLKIVFAIAGVMTLALVGFYFAVGQMLTPDSSLSTFIATHSPRRFQAILNGISSWILLYPDVTVDALFRVTLFWAAQLYGFLAFFAVALFVPKLISHDLSSRAILIYNSKAISHRDYLIGKFGIVATLLGLLCIAPVIIAWFLGNLASPDWSFFYHGFPALLRALTFAVIDVVVLSLLALAISSLGKRTSTATAFWIVGWTISGFVAQLANRVFSWGKYLNPGQALKDVSDHLYQLDQVWENAKSMLPLFDFVVQSLPRQSPLSRVPTLSASGGVPLLFLVGFCALALFVVTKRTRLD